MPSNSISENEIDHQYNDMVEQAQREFRARRMRLGLTQVECANVLGVTERIVRRWESSSDSESARAGPHPTAALFLKAIEDNEEIDLPYWPDEEDLQDFSS
tara:strand:+ start:416 stop:718 length:303 start_codon:yes stop_codon:yes gene_type:complete